jgi:alpha-mannosidase
LGHKAEIELLENGPLRATYKIATVLNIPEGIQWITFREGKNQKGERRKGKTVEYTITTYLTVNADSPRVDLRSEFNNTVHGIVLAAERAQNALKDMEERSKLGQAYNYGESYGDHA